jgi:tRNA1Val (adenine37-N6)-methyltransferase
MRAADTFHFQQFSVAQDRCAMKVGTDGVLLGAWASLPSTAPFSQPPQPFRVLDIGTGTGLIALMLAQRLSQHFTDVGVPASFEILALEPEPQAAAQARENTARSPWGEQIQIWPQPLAAALLTPADLWVCNPPFFAQKQRSPQPERAQARHSDPEFIDDFFARASQFLVPQGRISLVLPQDRVDAYLAAAQHAGWQWQKRCWVRHSAQHPVKRVLLEFVRTSESSQSQTEFLTETQTLCLKEKDPNGGWQDSAAYAQWVSPFYLRYQGHNDSIVSPRGIL